MQSQLNSLYPSATSSHSGGSGGGGGGGGGLHLFDIINMLFQFICCCHLIFGLFLFVYFFIKKEKKINFNFQFLSNKN